MAKYNREFLVPYLHDICALYLANDELERKIFLTERKIEKIHTGKTVMKPDCPSVEPGWTASRVGLVCVGGALIIMAMVAAYGFFSGNLVDISGGAIFFACAVLGGTGIAICKPVISDAVEEEKFNRKQEALYSEGMRLYYLAVEEVEAENRKRREEIPVLQDDIKFYTSEKTKVQHLLDKLYSANVIPSRYRDKYTAVYLYDFFSTARSNDMDMALNTYVLEQIKDRLDIIIRQQCTAILNQRMILANQRTALEQQREHNRYMEMKAREVSTSLEEQKQYLCMIESNTAANAYFAAANYLK